MARRPPLLFPRHMDFQLKHSAVVGVDTGTTFTYFVFVDDSGRITATKLPSSPADPSALSSRDFGDHCGELGHGARSSRHISGKGVRSGELPLVSSCGAGGLHAAGLAAAMGIPRVTVPRDAGVFSA